VQVRVLLPPTKKTNWASIKEGSEDTTWGAIMLPCQNKK